MMRLSEALTRFMTAGAALVVDAVGGAEVGIAGAVLAGKKAPSLSMRTCVCGCAKRCAEESGGSSTERLSSMPLLKEFCSDGLTSSSQVNIEVSNTLDYESSDEKWKVFIHIAANLCCSITSSAIHRMV